MSASSAELGVVVVSFHSAQTIEKCLHCLLSSPQVARIVVVDNASTDDTVARVEACARAHPRITLVRHDNNPGYAFACNAGASALATPWLAFVNPDVYLDAANLARWLVHARHQAGAGLLGTRLVDLQGRPDATTHRADPSLRELLFAGGRRDALYLGLDPAMKLQSVQACSGALMLMPLGLFLRIGGFDDGYRLHAEDLDLCRRVRAAGYEVCVANDVTAVHVGGVSSRARPWWVEWQKHRGLWRYHRKFEASLTAAWLQPLLWLGLWTHFAMALLLKKDGGRRRNWAP